MLQHQRVKGMGMWWIQYAVGSLALKNICGYDRGSLPDTVQEFAGQRSASFPGLHGKPTRRPLLCTPSFAHEKFDRSLFSICLPFFSSVCQIFFPIHASTSSLYSDVYRVFNLILLTFFTWPWQWYITLHWWPNKSHPFMFRRIFRVTLHIGSWTADFRSLYFSR